MAQPPQHFTIPPSYASPGASPSPATPQPFPMPPQKRQKLSPNPPSQPGSPYVGSPYGMSPNATTPQSASPHFSTVQLPQGAYNTPPQPQYNTPYANGHTTPTLSLPQQPNHNPPYQGQLNFPNQNPNQPGFQQNNNFMAPTQSAGTMGPPSKPIDKAKEDGIDPMDVLGGTGIDLREEEQYTFQMYNTSFNSQQSGSQSGTISSGHSFTQFPPGDERSFYGAGPANAAAEAPNTKSQEEFHRKAADKAWHDAARDLAISRQRELRHPFLEIGIVHKKMEKIAREYGLQLNMDNTGKMGTMKLPVDFPSPSVNVQTAMGPDGGVTVTSGNFIPLESLLVDQVALMSISTKHRLRGLLEDAARLAKGRQTGSHGIIPADWADIAAPGKATSATIVAEGAPRSGWESALSPQSNPLKRSLSATKIPTPISDNTKTPTPITKFSNEVVSALRGTALKERELEEDRLRKRRARASGEVMSRQSSVIPGTPGSVAPDPTEKAPTKKEQKKKAEAKVNEAASHAAANVTTAQFLGGGGGLFGKKKKYSWMTGGGAGGSASGTSTPGRIMTQGLPGIPTSHIASAAPERLTAEGARRLGTWREDKEKGQGIQIRDWITVLEDDGREKKALQRAYMWLDQSEPK